MRYQIEGFEVEVVYKKIGSLTLFNEPLSYTLP